MSNLSVDIRATFSGFALTIQQTFSLQGITGFFGHSGAGKSTLLKEIAGISQFSYGAIKLDQQTIQNSDTNTYLPCHKRQIVGVFQHESLFPHLSVEQNLFFGRKQLKKPNFSNQTVDKLITTANLTALLDRNVSSLSGGEKQKVAIVQAILAEPKLLVLDEPVSALDERNKAVILRLIKQLQLATKLPIFFVSHNINEHQLISDSLYVFEQGKIVNSGQVDDVIHQLNHANVSERLIPPQTLLTLTADSEKHPSAKGLRLLRLADGGQIFAQENNVHIDNESKLLRCYILASDISICTQSPHHSSIVNQLVGEITAIEISEHQALVTIDCYGQLFYSTITCYSLNQLALTVAQSVYIQFKASAVKQLLI